MHADLKALLARHHLADEPVTADSLATLSTAELRLLRDDVNEAFDANRASATPSLLLGGQLGDVFEVVIEAEVALADRGSITASGPASPAGLPSLSSIDTPTSHAPSVEGGNSRAQMADDFVANLEKLMDGTSLPPNDPTPVKLATVRVDFPDDRRLFGADEVVPNAVEVNDARLRDVVGPDALTAAGGLCSPGSPRWDQYQTSSAARPVRDSLPQFQAPRGRVQFTPAVTMAQVSSGVGIWTELTDQSPGGNTKNVVQVACPGVQTATADAVYFRQTFSNFVQRGNPERVAALIEVIQAQHARVAETKILDAISAASVQTTSVQVLGAARDLFPYFNQAAANYRGRQRMPGDAPLSILLPYWFRDLVRSDLGRSTPGDQTLSVSDAQIDSWLRAANLSPTYYLDSRTGAGQLAMQQANTDIADYPHVIGSIAALESYIFAPGTWTFIDSGELSLGVTRDSAGNAVNTFEIFYESFEGLMFTGRESLRLRSNVCPSGQSAIAVSSASVCTAS